MLGFFEKKSAPLLVVKVGGKVLCKVLQREAPCEKTRSIELPKGGGIEFIDHAGIRCRHDLGVTGGLYTFTIRIQPSLACQVDCTIAVTKDADAEDDSEDETADIRIQPFFITGAETANESLHGHGLFRRGLHFNGIVTDGAVLLSCLCDRCQTSFLIRSFHTGFGNFCYFYSGSGAHTLAFSDRLAGVSSTSQTPDPKTLAALEARLPRAPDGTAFKYLNPFRCPHCHAPFIDFGANPDERPLEYYGAYLAGADLLHYEPADR